jgi:hypothetical protein
MNVAAALANLGVFYQDIGHFSQAEGTLTNSLNLLHETRGIDDPMAAPLVLHLAWRYVETGRAVPAQRLLSTAWVDRFTSSNPDSKYLPLLLETLGGLNALEGRFAARCELKLRNKVFTQESGRTCFCS